MYLANREDGMSQNRGRLRLISFFLFMVLKLPLFGYACFSFLHLVVHFSRWGKKIIRFEFHGTDAFALQEDISMNWNWELMTDRVELNLSTAGRKRIRLNLGFRVAQFLQEGKLVALTMLPRRTHINFAGWLVILRIVLKTLFIFSSAYHIMIGSSRTSSCLSAKFLRVISVT